MWCKGDMLRTIDSVLLSMMCPCCSSKWKGFCDSLLTVSSCRVTTCKTNMLNRRQRWEQMLSNFQGNHKDLRMNPGVFYLWTRMTMILVRAMICHGAKVPQTHLQWIEIVSNISSNRQAEMLYPISASWVCIWLIRIYLCCHIFPSKRWLHLRKFSIQLRVLKE